MKTVIECFGRRTQATGAQIVRAKMTSLDAIFLQGKQVEVSLAFAAENMKNLPLALRARKKN